MFAAARWAPQRLQQRPGESPRTSPRSLQVRMVPIVETWLRAAMRQIVAARSSGAFVHRMLAELALQGPAMHAQPPRGFRNVAFAFLQRALDVFPFQPAQPQG